MSADGELVRIDDTSLFVVERGTGHPVIVLHGGPGLDHHEFADYLDPLTDEFRLLLVDQRANGRSERPPESTWTLERMAQDVIMLARAMHLDRYAVLGHSFGAFIALSHALERGTADQYVISSGAASTSALMADVERSIDTFEPAYLRDQIRKSWDEEPRLKTVEQAREVSAAQMPFHFWEMGDAYSRYMQSDDTVYAPEVLAHFAANGYGNFEWLDHLRWISKPMLVVTGRGDRVCTVERSEEIHREVEGSELVIVEKAAHMTFVEQPKVYFDAVRKFFIRQGAIPDPNAPPVPE